MTNSTRCALLAKQACTTLSHVVQKITPPSANNFLKLFFALFAMLALNVGNAWAAEVTMTAGTNGSECTVNDINGIKVGTSKAGGDMTITVPAGATSLQLYAAAWKGVTGLSINITPESNVNPTSISLTADDGITSNSPFTLKGNAESFKHEVTLSNITSATTLTLTSSTTKRFVVWGATCTVAEGENPGEGGGEPGTPGTGESGTIVIKNNSTFAPALPTTKDGANATSTEHTVENLTIKEQGLYNNGSGYIMFVQGKGFLYNTQSLGTITSVSVTYTGGTSTAGEAGVYFGSTEQSTYTTTSNQTIKGQSKTDTWINTTEGNGFFQLSTSNKNVQITQIEITYTSGGSPEPAYSVTVNQPAKGGAIEADKTEAKEGDIVKLIATPAIGYKFGAWDVKDASSNAVTVTDNQFTMPASNVIVSASFVAKTQYTIKWNVAEGSVADTQVYEGDALGTLPTAKNCSSGKVFVGWTEATSVNAAGSGLVLAKSTDVPDGNKEYNAVYATLSGSADKVDNLDLSLTGASGSTYSSWSGKKSVSDAVYAGNSAGGNDAIQLRKSSDSQAKSGIITTTSGGKAKKVVVTWNSNTASGRTLNVYGSNSAYSSVDNLYTDATAGTLIGTIVNGTSTELDITGDYEYIGMRSNASAMYLDKIQITWSASSASDYSLDCGTNNTPFLTVTETAFDFGTLAKDETTTKTFTVTGGYLAGDVALTISGTNASFFSVSPATITKADDVEETVTVTYNPTATGEHTATLTIKTGDITKTVALSGTVLAPGKWALVTDASQLNLGDEIIIVAADANVALSTAQNTNNRGQAEIVKVGNTVNAGDDVQILTLGQGTVENTYAFSTGSGYLYAAGTNSNNHLKTKTTLDATGSWAITIDNATGVATIKAQDSNTKRNWLRYNATNNPPIFSCYESGQKDVCVYRNTDVIAAPIISGNVDFTTETLVTITAQNGLTVYYTTNSSTPDKTATQYSAPFTINATTTVKAIAYDATDNASAVAEMTFTKHDLVNVATAMALAEDEVAYFDEFEVVKVVTGKGNIYIKDASGHGLIYDNTLAGELKDGDRVQGFVGISSPYNGLPEAKPVDGLTVADLTITSGVAAEPYDFTSTAIAANDLNKYIVFKEVPMDADVDVTTHPTLTINGNSVNFRNTFNITKTLENGKKYDIYGFVSIYNENLQVSFYQALEQGEVVKTYTVTYNTGGATGEVPVDDNEYTEGAQVYLKSATGLTKDGFNYVGWKVTDESANEINVVENKFNMPASNVTVTAQWEEVKTYDQGAWVLVTDASELAVDDDVIIAAANDNYALGKDQKSNNRGTVTIVKGSNVALLESDVQILTLENGNHSGTLALSTGKGYLYAASSEKNYLRTETSLSDNSSWTIEINEAVATIEAQGTNTHNLLQYNSTSNIFSCYSSEQQPVAIYEYNPNERVITFDVNGGEAYAHTYVATTGGSLTLPTDVPTHATEGQLFSSWNDKQDGSGNTYNAGDIDSFTEHTTLYAQWTVADAYHVTYNIAGASGTTPVDANHYYGGENITLAPQGDLVNPGHIFAGWNVVDANNTEILVTENTFIMPQSDVTATAKWVRKTNDKWVLVTSTEQLIVGDKYVIACNTKNAIAGKIVDNAYMQHIDATFSEDKSVIVACSKDPQILTLGKEENQWTFTNDDGKYLSNDDKTLKWAEEKYNWTIVIEDEYTAIAIPGYAIYYNPSAPRFKTYDTGVNYMLEIQLYRLIPNQVVTGEKTDNDVPQHSNVTVENGGDLSVGNSDTQYGDVYINNGGSVEVDDNAQLTVNNLYISTTMGATTSGQLNTAAEDIIVNGDVFIDITLGKNGDPDQWHAFTVPFPVDAMNGVYDLNDNKLTNEVNYAIMDYHGDLRANGQYGWKKYRGILVPGTFYLMTVDGARTTYRFKKVKGAAIVASTTKAITAFTGSGDPKKDKGWNGVGNPTLMHGKVAYDAQILDPESYTYKTIKASSSAHFTVGTPFFIQAATHGTMTMTTEPSASLAPARRAATAVENIKVMLGNSDYTDYLYVSASEDATNEYEIGKDLAKMTMTKTPSVPQIFAEAYNTSLCMIDAPMANNEALVALNLYAPANGEYTLSIEAQDNEKVYLLHEGTFVWDLSMSEYPITLKQGDNAGYSLLVRRADAPTSVETIDGANNQTEKLIHNGNLYILHNGKVFDAVGTMLK